MKKVMSILTVAVLVVGAAAMVSFTMKEKSAEPTTAWFYMKNGIPDTDEGAQTEVSLDCEDVSSEICAAKYHVDSENPNQPIAPTGEVRTGERPL